MSKKRKKTADELLQEQRQQQQDKEIQEKKNLLHNLSAKLSFALQDYKLLTPELISEVTEALKTDDYEKCRDAYHPLILLCFQFKATKIKATVGINKDERIDNIIKTTAGFFLIDAIKTAKIIEYGLLLTIMTTGEYISNTALNILEQLADELKQNKWFVETITREIKNYLEIGGMKLPGENKIIPFTPQKKERLKKLLKLYTPEFDGRLLSDISGEEV